MGDPVIKKQPKIYDAVIVGSGAGGGMAGAGRCGGVATGAQAFA